MKEEHTYLSFDQIVEKFPFSEAIVRKWLFKRRDNGLNVAIRKIGGKIYFRKDLFIEWIEQHKDN